jgi:hypothetical protein
LANVLLVGEELLLSHEQRSVKMESEKGPRTQNPAP